MLDLIKSITTESINDALSEVFETADSITLAANTEALVYDPVSKEIGKTVIPPDVTAIATAAQQTANAASKKQTLPSTTRALPFTCDPTVIEQITTTADITFTLDETDAQNGNGVLLSVLQNHKIHFPSIFIELAGSRDYVPGKLNYYLIYRVAGTYQWICYQSKLDAVNTSVITVGSTILTAGTITDSSVVLNWTDATNALTYNLYRYLNADFSDTPVQIGTGLSVLTFTDTGLTPLTPYYYKIQGLNGSSVGNAGTITITTIAAITYTTTHFTDYTTDGLAVANDGGYGGRTEIDNAYIVFYPGNGAQLSYANNKLNSINPTNGYLTIYLAPNLEPGNYKLTASGLTSESGFVMGNSNVIETSSTYINGVKTEFFNVTEEVHITYGGFGLGNDTCTSIKIERQN